MSTRASRTRVAVAGFGTVGRAVVSRLQAAQDEIELVGILTRDGAPRTAEGVDPDAVGWTASFDELLAARPEVFVELIGGRSTAIEWTERALAAGVSVVTANKQAIAHHGRALLAKARDRGVQLRFEAAVAGGVPVIRGIEDGLAGDTLTRVAGVLNGTCNYILTRMERDGASFADALSEAQGLGFAEADPAEDIEGLDAQAKLAILSMVAFGVAPRPADVAARGIAAVEPIDFAYARRLGCTIRQAARAERVGADALSAAVGPALVPVDSPLARVAGSENLVMVEGRGGGATSFGGRGAGGGPTAVAVVSDVLAIARGARLCGRTVVPASAVLDEAPTPFYVRCVVADRPGIIAAVAPIFAKRSINIDAVLQEPGYPAAERPFVISLEAAPVRLVEEAVAEIGRLDCHRRPPIAMPVFTAAADGGAS